MQSSLVHVPCRSGSPQGVFGAVHARGAPAAVLAAGAAEAGAGAFCASRPTATARTASGTRNGYFISSLLTKRAQRPRLLLLCSFRCGFFNGACTGKRIEHSVITFVTCVFKIRIAGLLRYGKTD